MSDDKQAIHFTYLSQEDLLESGCLDFELAIAAAESAMLANRDGDVIFPEKIVQIFDEETQKRINCLPATLLNENVCGMKWVSVFPPNVSELGLQNLTALFVLSETEKGFPLAVLEGTLASNVRVGAMGGLAAKHLRGSRRDRRRVTSPAVSQTTSASTSTPSGSPTSTWRSRSRCIAARWKPARGAS